MNPDQNITLTLSVDEVNQILSALGQLPYTQVFQLVHKIHQESEKQLGDSADKG